MGDELSWYSDDCLVGTGLRFSGLLGRHEGPPCRGLPILDDVTAVFQDPAFCRRCPHPFG